MFDNGIVITSNSSKKQILKNNKKLLNIKFYTIDEFLCNLYFNYDYKTIDYIMKKYNTSYELSLLYIKNLLYLEIKEYDNDKLNFLSDLKKELIDNNLLIKNDDFKDYIKNKNIYLYNITLTKYQTYLLKDITFKIVNDTKNIYKPVVYEFDTIEEEIEYIAYTISDLIYNGFDIEKIKLTNVVDEYIPYINKIFNFYNLKISKKINSPIISTIIGKTFYNNLSNVEEGLKSIDKYKDTDIYNKIIDIINKYTDITDPIELIKYDLKHTNIPNIHYTNEIEVVDLRESSFNDEKVFLMSFNQNIIPNYSNDFDYINDSIKEDYMDNTIDKNNYEKSLIIDKITSIKDLTITYKLKTPFNNYLPSPLISELSMEVKRVNIDNTISYSDYDKVKFSILIDDLIKYGYHPNLLDLYYSNYSIPYNTYSNNFTGINKNKIDKKYNLSYTSMDNYNRCAFRYYINKVLKVDDIDKKFSLEIGNIYHHILELYIRNKNIDIRKSVYEYIDKKDIELKNSEKFIVEKIINNIPLMLEELDNEYNNLNYKNILTEKMVKVPIKDNISFIGFIDKLIYNDTLDKASIVDYKTYIKSPSRKYFKEGIGLQLPTYMYLTRYMFPDIKFSGIYLQNISLKNLSKEDFKNDVKLIGYTNDNSKYDLFKDNSEFIKGIKYNQDGSLSGNSKNRVITDLEIEEYINDTKESINKTISGIEEGEFSINPKFDKELLGCEFCNYKDICFKNISNYTHIKGGDIDVD